MARKALLHSCLISNSFPPAEKNIGPRSSFKLGNLPLPIMERLFANGALGWARAQVPHSRLATGARALAKLALLLIKTAKIRVFSRLPVDGFTSPLLPL